MNRKLKIFISIVIGFTITTLIRIPMPEYLIDSNVMIQAVLISFAWFLLFVGISNASYRLLGRVKK
ncbi:hypothetical protein [Marinifilum caeruleilacunae]|jgi:hypothetical protein|uniref:Uncharacterized protein n=1 Tax=Marinifilum caeruleilacunae TaxID=2499076 RepID=A0ABX1WYU1_9BACT|nr:hypothetical protein [Marinifilum caeruleilacunae]NOU61271.1 hypothetical protein [Marinifilum caeruleilacunae]